MRSPKIRSESTIRVDQGVCDDGCIRRSHALLLSRPRPVPRRPAAGPGAPPSRVRDLAGKVESARLSRTVDRLASFGTRHTLSDPLRTTAGIGAARRWLGGEFQALTRLPGSRLVAFEDPFQAGPGPPLPRRGGPGQPGRAAAGHRPGPGQGRPWWWRPTTTAAPRDVAGRRADAPGAVDNASGVALVLEMATVLAAERPAVSIYFVATAGGRAGPAGQRAPGRSGSRPKAPSPRHGGRRVRGQRPGPDGSKNGGAMRLFSDGVPARESDGQRRVRELLGTENDGASRELARYLKRVRRALRGRTSSAWSCCAGTGWAASGEQAAFNRQGYPGVRVTELVDPFDRLAPERPPGAAARTGDTARLLRLRLLRPDHPDAGGRVPPAVLRPRARPRTSAWAAAAPATPSCGGPCPRTPGSPASCSTAAARTGSSGSRPASSPRAKARCIPGIGTDTDVFAVATVDAQGNESLPVSPRSIEFWT